MKDEGSEAEEADEPTEAGDDDGSAEKNRGGAGERAGLGQVSVEVFKAGFAVAIGEADQFEFGLDLLGGFGLHGG